MILGAWHIDKLSMEPSVHAATVVFQGTQELAKQVKNLPQANYNLLKYICK